MRTNRNNFPLLLVVIMVSLLISCEREEFETCDDLLSDGLVSFYGFDGNPNDYSGKNHGIEYNVEYLENDPFSTNQVLMLNGFSSLVDLQNPFDYEEITLSIWFNAHYFGSIFDLIYTSDNPFLNYGLLNIAVRNENGINNLNFNVSGQNVTVEIEKNKWYHVTVTRNKKEFKYYLNGTLIESGSFENYLTSDAGSQTAIIGCKRTFENGYFNGLIDNLRIYDKALSEKDIKKIYECRK